MPDEPTAPGYDQVARQILSGYKGAKSKTVKLVHPDLHMQRRIADTVRGYLDERKLRVAVYLDVNASPVELVLRPLPTKRKPAKKKAASKASVPGPPSPPRPAQNREVG